jgi:hypothetical protein
VDNSCGQAKHIAGHFLSLYCLYKIVMAGVNLAFHREKKKDPVTNFFDKASPYRTCMLHRRHACFTAGMPFHCS